MKAYVVVNKKGKIVKEAGISFSKEDAVEAMEDFVVDAQGKEHPSGEKVMGFIIPESN